MIYREQKLEKVTLASGDICKECILLDCIVPNGVHLEGCLVVETPKKKKKKTKECAKCKDQDGKCEDCIEVNE
jgi:hypothetical protein